MIVGGLSLLALRQVEREQFVTRRSGRTSKVPDRDRRQQAAIVLSRIDEVADQIAAIRAEQSGPGHRRL